jgi:hypothetical protein
LRLEHRQHVAGRGDPMLTFVNKAKQMPLAAKSSRFGLERAWQHVSRASLASGRGQSTANVFQEVPHG